MIRSAINVFFMLVALGLFSACSAEAPDATEVADAAVDDTLMPKISLAATGSTEITATVEALNYETREATLRGEDGNAVSFVVSDAVERLDEISVGDVVTVEYDELFTIEVYENDGEEPDVAELGVLARTAEGEAPGGAVVDTLVITAVVDAIDLEENTATLRLSDGSMRTVEARNPENLRKASVGDLVVMSVTQAVAISVAPPAAN
jgi:hypothetical protein